MGREILETLYEMNEMIRCMRYVNNLKGFCTAQRWNTCFVCMISYAIFMEGWRTKYEDPRILGGGYEVWAQSSRSCR